MGDLSIDENTASRSIVVSSLPSGVDENEIVMHFQSRKHGGGDIEKVVLLGNGSAIVTFDNNQCVASVQEKHHHIQGVMLAVQACPYVQAFSNVSAKIDPDAINLSVQDTRAMVDRLQQDQNVKYTERGDATFLISGSYNQIVKCHGLLCALLLHVHDKKHSSHRTGTTRQSHDIQLSTKEQNGKVFIENDSIARGKRMDEEGKNGMFTEREEKLNESEKPLTQTPKESHQRNVRNGGTANGQVNKRKKDFGLNECDESVKPSAQKPKESCQRNSRGASEKKETEVTTSSEIPKESCPRNTKEKSSQEKFSVGQMTPTTSKDVSCFEEIKVSEKEWYVFTKVSEDHLKKLKEKYAVEIVEQSCTVLIKPLKDCSKDMVKKATKTLCDMYDNVTKSMECVTFALADQSNEQMLRKTILDIKKTFPVVLERASDRQSWEVFGECNTVEEILKLLESKVKIRKLDPRSEGSDSQDIPDDDDGDDDDDDDGDGDLDDDVGETVISDYSDDNADDDNPSKRLEHDLGNVKLSVYKGDITDETSDAIVNAANQSLRHDAGVAMAIVSKGGSSIQDESTRIVATKGKLKTGNSTITPSGDLSCKMVIHAVGPIWNARDKENCKALLEKAIFSSLHQAGKYGFKSISFPAISSGIYGMPKHVCAKVMFDAVEEYNNSSPTSRDFKVNDVRFVNNDIKTVNVFQREFRTRYGHGEVRPQPETKEPIRDKKSKAHDDFGRPINQQTTCIPSSWLAEDNAYQLNRQKLYRRGKEALQANPIFSYDGTTSVPSLKLQDPQSERSMPRPHQSRSNSVKITKQRFPPAVDAVQLNHEQIQSRSVTGGSALLSDGPGGYGGARPKNKSTSQPINGHLNMHHEGGTISSSKKRTREDQPDKKCPICLARIIHPKTLPKCRHTFCKGCLEKALKKAAKCPLCRDPLPTRHIGNQPDGTMVHRVEQFSLPGYDQYGTIVIQYSFNEGIQGDDHPNPGQPYGSTSRPAYLPNNKRGQEVLKLLRIAFDCKLVFTIGRSITSMRDNQIVWGDIPHKSSIDSGPLNYGYPDPTYLPEVHQILKAMLSQQRV